MFNKAISITTINEFTLKKKNLFIVTNPMQFLNACESQYFFKTKNNILVFLFFKGHNQSEELLKNKDLFPYTQLIILDTRDTRNTISENITLIKILQKYSYEKVFMGYFSLNMRRYLCNINYEDFFLFDDGTYTIALHSELYNPNYNNAPSMLHLSKLRKKRNSIRKRILMIYEFYRMIVFKLNGLNNDMDKYYINFFTIYNLPLYKNERIVVNKYTLLQSKLNKFKKISTIENIVYFLGQPLNKVLDIDFDKYIAYLKIVIDYYAEENVSIYYVPHKSERYSSKKIEEKLSSKNFRILIIDKPFELYILDREVKPYRIASFFSSGLLSLKVMYPSLNIDSFVIPYDKEVREDITAIYKVIKRSKIVLVDNI